jgi:hypothetical protein
MVAHIVPDTTESVFQESVWLSLTNTREWMFDRNGISTFACGLMKGRSHRSGATTR